MYKATLQLNAKGHGCFQYETKTEGSLQIVIYGDDPKEIRQEAIRALTKVIGHPHADRSKAFQKDFRRLPEMLMEKLEDQSCSFDLPYDPYEFPPEATWAISKYSGDEVIIVLQ